MLTYVISYLHPTLSSLAFCACSLLREDTQNHMDPVSMFSSDRLHAVFLCPSHPSLPSCLSLLCPCLSPDPSLSHLPHPFPCPSHPFLSPLLCLWQGPWGLFPSLFHLCLWHPSLLCLHSNSAEWDRSMKQRKHEKRELANAWFVRNQHKLRDECSFLHNV